MHISPVGFYCTIEHNLVLPKMLNFINETKDVWNILRPSLMSVNQSLYKLIEKTISLVSLAIYECFGKCDSLNGCKQIYLWYKASLNKCRQYEDIA
jgi:hypothetical protein